MLKESKPPVAALPVWAWFVSLSIAAFLCVRNSGIVPFVFSDEYSYSMYTRLAPIAEAIVPDYLYFFVFGVSKECGDGFMDCVRGMNVAIFVASAPFIYMTCRRVAGVVFSCWVTGLAILGPLNSYTAYFMPEATYFFAFWSITWFALSLDENSKTAHWGGAGWGSRADGSDQTSRAVPIAGILHVYDLSAQSHEVERDPRRSCDRGSRRRLCASCQAHCGLHDSGRGWSHAFRAFLFGNRELGSLKQCSPRGYPQIFAHQPGRACARDNDGIWPLRGRSSRSRGGGGLARS